ncbi:methionyl-tRNA_formyltransferase [Leishmania braziliensis MHOM/BR/75/M2904]|nr:methionyl-tRNA_formyltransferase [Leishmania braziliensis MHOM/BR/75/M2904]
MPALARSAVTFARAADALQTVYGCGGAQLTCFRTRRVSLAAVRGEKLRTYTTIPLSHSNVSPQTSSNAQYDNVGVNSRSTDKVKAATPVLSSSAPFTATTTSDPVMAFRVKKLRVRETFLPAPQPACVRLPRLLVFGGDLVSVTALEALHTRMRCIVASALRCSKTNTSNSDAAGAHCPPPTAASSLQGHSTEAGATEGDEFMEEVDAFVRDHITVVCPTLPLGMRPETVAKKFARQYPVARYCVEHGLPIIPVDDPKSLSRSALLKEMLDSGKRMAASATNSHTHHFHRNAPLLNHQPSHAPSSSVQCCRTGAGSPPLKGLPKGSSFSSSAFSATPHTWVAQGRPLADYDLTVVVSFRYFLPKSLLLALPPVINMHPSLLPRYRGASPIFSALLRNEAIGGVSIIQMKPGQTAMDSGNVLWQCEVPIPLDMDIRLYFPLVTQIGAAGLCDLIFGKAPPVWRPSLPTADVSVPASPLTSERPSASTFHCSSRCQPHTRQGGADYRLANAVSANSATTPSWFALRQRCLAPLVHRSDGRIAAPTSVMSRNAHLPMNVLFNVAELPFLSSLPASTKNYHVERIHHVLRSLGGMTQSNCTGSSEEAPSTDDPEASHHRVCQPWMTLGRAPTPFTAKAVQDARERLRTLHLPNLKSPSGAAAQKWQKSSTGMAVTKCKGAPASKQKISLAVAAELGIKTTIECAEIFPASVLSPHCDWPDSFIYSWKLAQVQTYPTYAHFSEDPYHAPLLPKDAAVVRFSSMNAAEAFGVWRAFVGGDYFQPSVSAMLDKSSTPVRNQLVRRALRRLLLQRAKTHATFRGAGQQRSKCTGARDEKALAAALTLTSDDNEVPVGIVAGKHVDLDILNPAGVQLLTEAESTLRTPCTFTQVINPVLAPACVCEELAEVEQSGHLPPRFSICTQQHPERRWRVRFYRAPPAIFRSLLCRSANDSATQKTTRWRRCEPRLAMGECGMAATDGAMPSLRQQECEVDGEGKVPASITTSTRAASLAGAEKGQRQLGHRHPSAGDVAMAAQAEESGEHEEAPEDYVPEVIHAAPPSQHPLHIPPGTGYFPQSDESYGAIKCKEGWFLWKEAHMKCGNKAQPAVLIRKGLAMKTGVLYVGLFSEYL